jgi:hypothetical protein
MGEKMRRKRKGKVELQVEAGKGKAMKVMEASR